MRRLDMRALARKWPKSLASQEKAGLHTFTATQLSLKLLNTIRAANVGRFTLNVTLHHGDSDPTTGMDGDFVTWPDIPRQKLSWENLTRIHVRLPGSSKRVHS